MPKMRAKYYVESVTKTAFNTEIIKLSAVINGTPEDNTFHKYTPFGVMEITISNPVLLNTFEPKQKYYLDFTLASE